MRKHKPSCFSSSRRLHGFAAFRNRKGHKSWYPERCEPLLLWVGSTVWAASAKLMFLIKNFTDFFIFFFPPGKTLLFNPQPRLQAPPFAFGAVQTSKTTPRNDKICHRDGWGYSRKKNEGAIHSFSLEFITIKTKGNLYCVANAK